MIVDLIFDSVKGKVFYDQENILPHYHRMLGQLSTILAVMLLMHHNEQLPDAVDHSKLRTMVSDSVDPVD